VFSKVGDQMAGFAVAGLEQFQKAGEGLFETLMRLAKDYLTVDAALKSIGLTFGSVGVASSRRAGSLIDLMGGLDQFVSQINYYYDHFLTAAEQTSSCRARSTRRSPAGHCRADHDRRLQGAGQRPRPHHGCGAGDVRRADGDRAGFLHGRDRGAGCGRCSRCSRQRNC
jgi:hypothetical protein